MKFFRTFALSAALLSTAGWAFGQDYHYGQYQDHRDGRDSREYRDGYNQGRADASSGRGRHPGSDHREYRDGYEAGYSSVRNSGRYQNGGGYGPGGYGPNNGGAYGGDINRMAQQNGLRDGANDGQRDRQTGHSFRPTSMDNYKNAPGYTGTHGSDRDQYKNIYRQAYQQGYQEGYNGGGGRRR
jgi:hypothetical protein